MYMYIYIHVNNYNVYMWLHTCTCKTLLCVFCNREWSDCQDADVKVEKEAKEKLVGLNTRLQKLNQSGNILVAILHSVDVRTCIHSLCM